LAEDITASTAQIIEDIFVEISEILPDTVVLRDFEIGASYIDEKPAHSIIPIS
jgi:hypothetical protein